MAKKQSFGDKIKKRRDLGRQMAKVVSAEKKPNGHYRFKQKMVHIDEVQNELKAAKNAI
jgi:hypothetical protein